MDRPVEQLVDEILVMDCQSGSVKAMEILVSRWQKRLWKYACNMTGDAEAAWDITQESWLGIIKGMRKLQDPASFKAWAYRITTNKSIDWIKKNKTIKKIGLDEVDDHQHTEEKDAGLKELLSKLNMKSRTVLTLYYFEQLSVPEIGVALKIPGGTVKSRLHNARNEFKTLWQKYIEP
ncbi:MAG: sigma-70 family RNA polymerase sigma factor [Sedimentisphaerales bacterium]|nr:sigma-70 family RNA polymerase sigma factor [Sedimentisphaerales bacterium]